MTATGLRYGVFAAVLMFAHGAAAATVFATVSVAGQQTIVSDPTFVDVSRSGFGSADDLNEDVAAARADVAAGEIKFRVLDGGVFSGAPIARPTANANMRETVTLNTRTAGAPEVQTVGLAFEADVDTSIGTAGGTFNQNILADGATASGEFRYDLTETGILNGAPSSVTYSLRAIFQQGTAFRFNDQGVLIDEFFFVEPTGTPVATPAPLLPHPFSRVIETRARFDVVSPFFYAGVLEIDLLIDGPHTIDFFASVTGNVRGAAAFSAGIDSFNSARLFIDAPGGGTFTSESGVFLTAAAVPLPPSALLLAASMGLLAVGAKVRGHSGRADRMAA